MVDGGSTVSWSDDAVFAYNTAALYGGAVNGLNGSSVSWSAPTVLYSNSAWLGGGALYIALGSTISWSGATTFDANSAGSDLGIGGALTVSLGSNASWSGVTTYMNNVAGSAGGAALIYTDSNVSWSGVAAYINYVAGEVGGGVVVFERSHACCTGETTSTFSDNSAELGGALFIESYSSISFSGISSFDNNNATRTSVYGGLGHGGAVVVSATSTATWYGLSAFTGNTATKDGGALYVSQSTVSWSDETIMALNNASDNGGALETTGSNISWIGKTEILNNSADGGGALHVHSSSCSMDWRDTIWNNSGVAVHASGPILSWSGNTTLAHNRAEDGFGGALTAFVDTSVFWSGGSTRFVENFASLPGGVLYVYGSNVSWRGDTEFVEVLSILKTAVTFRGAEEQQGLPGTMPTAMGRLRWTRVASLEAEPQNLSAILLNNLEELIIVRSEGHVSWTGDTSFASNTALRADGGAVGTDTLASGHAVDATLVMNRATRFSNNTAGANGGGLALLGGCALDIDTADVMFVGNSARVAGGGIFMSGVTEGPTFAEVTFISNSAEIEGALSIFASGTEGGHDDCATTFSRCRFLGNRAATTGGAINSVAGQDDIESSIFEDNSAGTGGAMRLAGAASVNNCSFVESTSNDGEGPAMPNIGYFSRMENNYFSSNGFDCPSSMFLDYIAVRVSCVRTFDNLTINMFSIPWQVLHVTAPLQTTIRRVSGSRLCVEDARSV